MKKCPFEILYYQSPLFRYIKETMTLTNAGQLHVLQGYKDRQKNKAPFYLKKFDLGDPKIFVISYFFNIYIHVARH